MASLPGWFGVLRKAQNQFCFGILLSPLTDDRFPPQSEVISLLRCLSAGKNKFMSVDELFTNASTNVICTMLMSIRFRPNNPSFLRFMELHDEGFKLFLKCDIANYIPALKYVPSITENFQKLIRSRDETCEMIRDIIKQRREIFDPENIRDILDSYLLEEHNAKLEGRVLYEGKEFGE